jgi:hypothetical protein
MPFVTVICWALALGLLSRITSSYISKYNLKKRETTVGQIVGLLIQLLICTWSAKVVLNYGYNGTFIDIQNILCLGIGYYIYDMFHMTSYETQQLFTFELHHFGTIVILMNGYYNDDVLHPYIFGAVFIPLELSSACLNIYNLYKIFIHKNKTAELLYIIFYGLSRILAFPVFTIGLLCYYFTFEQMFERIFYYKYALPATLLTLLYVLSVSWFKTMVHKYYIT